MRLLAFLLVVPLFITTMWLARLICRRWWRAAGEADQMAVATALAVMVVLAWGVGVWVWL